MPCSSFVDSDSAVPYCYIMGNTESFGLCKDIIYELMAEIITDKFPYLEAIQNHTAHGRYLTLFFNNKSRGLFYLTNTYDFSEGPNNCAADKFFIYLENSNGATVYAETTKRSLNDFLEYFKDFIENATMHRELKSIFKGSNKKCQKQQNQRKQISLKPRKVR